VLRAAPEGVVGVFERLTANRAAPRRARARPDAMPLLGPAQEPSALQLEGLSVSFGGVRAVIDLAFEARAGRITSIIGPNGAGKSRVLNLACGFYRPDTGAIRLGGRDIAGLASHAAARAGIARTYQTTQLFTHMSVLDNVLVALERGRLGFSSLFSPD